MIRPIGQIPTRHKAHATVGSVLLAPASSDLTSTLDIQLSFLFEDTMATSRLQSRNRLLLVKSVAALFLSRVLSDVADDDHLLARASECWHYLIGDSDSFRIGIVPTFGIYNSSDAGSHIVIHPIDAKCSLVPELL